MPFVTEGHRQYPDSSIPGDRCFLTYRFLVKQWTSRPSWTLFDYLVSDLFPELDEQRRADFLALLVFFQIHIMPYELEKRRINGNIE